LFLKLLGLCLYLALQHFDTSASSVGASSVQASSASFMYVNSDGLGFFKVRLQVE